MNTKGFTLLELLVTIAVVVLLLAFTSVAYEKLIERSRKAKCISHLRAFHGALSNSIIDENGWPQVPIDNGEKWDEDKYFGWWVTKLQNYGMSRDSWICPSDRENIDKLRKERASGKEKKFFGTYVPSKFEPGANTPFRFNQPWMVERGDFHGTGGHVLMPDGSVTPKMNPFAGR